MSVQPKDWSVVIVGAWNLAILTPDGIRKRLLSLPDGTPVQIEVAIDQPGSFRVVHEEVIVAPSQGKLDLVAQLPSLNVLKKAVTIGQAALNALPETPFAAAGINIRYEFDELPAGIYDLSSAPIDEKISDSGFSIKSASLQRALELDGGMINLSLTHEDGAGSLVMNFHLPSGNAKELIDWIGRVDEFHRISQSLVELFDLDFNEGA